MAAGTDRRIASLAATQAGRVARRQLIADGIGRRAIARRLEDGRLRPTLVGIYAVGPVSTWLSRLWEAHLFGGPDSVLSHRAAAILWKFADFRVLDVTLSVRRRGTPGLVCHRSSIPDTERTTHHGLPVTTPARTLLDLASILPEPRMRPIFTEAEVLDRVDQSSVRALLAARGRSKGAVLLRRLAGIEAGHVRRGRVRSRLELRFRELTERHPDWPPSSSTRGSCSATRSSRSTPWYAKRDLRSSSTAARATTTANASTETGSGTAACSPTATGPCASPTSTCGVHGSWRPTSKPSSARRAVRRTPRKLAPPMDADRRSQLEERTRYDAGEVEGRIFASWLEAGYFHPEPEGTAAENYSIAIPPPNVTGSLHMGHALNGTIQDAMARKRRMEGRRVKWILGTDHAGIATQSVVEKELRAEGVSRHDLGREAFVERVWEWRSEYGDTDHRAVQAARRLLRLRGRALHPRRRLRDGRLPRSSSSSSTRATSTATTTWSTGTRARTRRSPTSRSRTAR